MFFKIYITLAKKKRKQITGGSVIFNMPISLWMAAVLPLPTNTILSSMAFTDFLIISLE